MAYSVTLSKQVSANSTDSSIQNAVKVVMEVTSVTDFIDAGIFVYSIDPVTLAEVYSHVALPSDLGDFNFDVVGDNDFVRKSDFERIYESAELAHTAIDTIESSILDLCNNMAVLDTLGDATTVTISADIL